LTLSEVLNPVNNESSVVTSFSDSLTNEVNDSSLAENSTSEVAYSESEIEGSENSSEALVEKDINHQNQLNIHMDSKAKGKNAKG